MDADGVVADLNSAFGERARQPASTVRAISGGGALLVHEIAPDRDLGRSPLFQALFTKIAESADVLVLCGDLTAA